MSQLAPWIPVETPRLKREVYDLVLSALLDDVNSCVAAKAFLQCVQKWSRKTPAAFNHMKLLAALEHLQIQSESVHSVSAGGRSGLHSLPYSWCYLEAQALLYIARSEYGKALNCYLEIEVPESWSAASIDNADNNAQYRHVFELIEKQSLFSTVAKKILNLVRLSKPLSRRLLMTHLDKLPVSLVATQLAAVDRGLLLWYLDALFSDAFETYCHSEYEPWHVKQVELYVEFSPPAADELPASFSSLAGGQGGHKRKGLVINSALMRFLQSELATPALLQQVALPACSGRKPTPLYREMVFILSKLGESKKALQLYLKEIGDLLGAIAFIEEQKRDRGLKVALSLWEDLIDASIRNTEQLAVLLDYLGTLSNIDPVKTLQRMDKDVGVPLLKERLLKILRHELFRESQHRRCRDLLEEDALKALRQKNQGLRRAIKVRHITLPQCAC